MKALIDGDIIAFRCAAASEKEDVGICFYYMNQLIEQVMYETKADSYQIYLSGKNNFRYDIYPEYKANRDKQFIPQHRQEAKDFLVSQYKAIVSEGCEADDLMGVAQCTALENTVIVTLDKDLLMIPGRHYSWEISGRSKTTTWTKPAIHQTVSEEEGLHFFFMQVLCGDVADNIKGVPGIGPAKAERILPECGSPLSEYVERVEAEFSCREEFEMNAKCLWIWRKENDIWEYPTNESFGD